MVLGEVFVLMLTFETWGDCRVESLADRLDTLGLEVADVLEMTVAGLAMWKLTSADTLSAPTPAMFSRDRDFIMDSSERVFLGSFESGESCTPGWSGCLSSL